MSTETASCKSWAKKENTLKCVGLMHLLFLFFFAQESITVTSKLQQCLYQNCFESEKIPIT